MWSGDIFPFYGETTPCIFLSCQHPSYKTMGIRVLCLAVFLAAAVQPYVTVGVGGSAPLRLHLCSFLPLEPTRASGERVSSPFAASLIGAGAAAVENINQRNFTSLPDGAALIGDSETLPLLLA